MAKLSTIQKSIAPELESLDARIRAQLGTANPMMQAVIDTYLRTKGKQIRPIIVLLSAKMFGTATDRVMGAAAAVELLHNASLIHDDVVDDSKMRRNQPTINAIWDNHISVLVGDFFVSSAMQQAIGTGDLRIIDALCHLGKLLSLGELDQIYNARYHNLSEDAYFHIINYKTASLFVACAQMGGYAVDAPQECVERLAQFAELLGLCFQIRDDIYDYYASEEVGKPTGNDLREGKITLPLLHVLLDEHAPDHEAMLELSRQEELSAEQIETLMAYARDNGGVDYAYHRMEQLREQAAAIMAELPQCEAAQQLLSLFDITIAR